MKVIIDKSRAEGTVTAPPSKSMAHRALICGALSGESRVNNLAYSKDISATLDCLIKMGAKTENTDDGCIIGGLDPFAIKEGTVLYCNESGSTLRFFIPLCLLSGNRITLTGSSRLFERPLTVYEDICRQQNIYFEKTGDSLTVQGRLKSGTYNVPGDISSQFITGFMFALPLLEGDSEIRVVGRFESESYIDLTLSVLADFGIEITRNDNTFYIKGGQKYASTEHTVEGDCSNAAFLDGLNYLGGSVEVLGIKEDTLRGDRVYKDIYRRLKEGEKQFDLSDCPDLAPVLFAVAATKGGAFFTGTARLKIKESDRAVVMAEELSKFGIDVVVGDNTVEVKKGDIKKPECELFGHNDHRIVMSLALLCTLTGGIIEGAEAVSKSYPDFFEKLSDLKVGITKL